MLDWALLEAAGAALDDVRGDRVLPPDDLPDRLTSELSDPTRADGPVHRVLRTLGWTPPPTPPRTHLRQTGDLLDLLAAGWSVHEAADRLGLSVDVLRDELVALRRQHACTSTAEVVRRARGGGGH